MVSGREEWEEEEDHQLPGHTIIHHHNNMKEGHYDLQLRVSAPGMKYWLMMER